MRVDIEGGKYTYVFEDGRARLLRYGEPSRRDVVGDKLIYCMAAEIAELRQRIADLEAERDNAWTELREIREAISANPEESTLDEVVKLRQQLVAMTEERDTYMRDYGKEQDRKREVAQKLAAAQTQSAKRLEGLCKCGVEKDQLHEQVTLLRDALEYHQAQTRPIQTTIDALAATEPKT